jgi:predicted metal-dependent enzyme (double-stranded beta helix superfamily)
MLRGAERSCNFVRDANTAGTAEASGPLREGDEMLLTPGQVAAVSPSVGDIHRVSNAYNDRVSISIHVYGADIGKVQRSVYSLDGPPKRFVSGYATPFTAPLAAEAPSQANRISS